MEPSKKNKSSKKIKNLCHQFQNTGRCSYGDSCKFVHYQNTSPHPPPPAHGEGLLHHPSSKAPMEPMDEFFSQYPDFEYKRDAPFSTEFRRMSRQFRWNNDQRKGPQADFKAAMVEQFNSTFGTDEKSLESWQRLCRVLGIGVPSTLKESRLRVQRTHVNLVDLTESPYTGKKVEIFPTVEALRKYTLEEKKVFPKNEAHAGGLLKTLLRQILMPMPPKTQANQPVRKRVDSGVDLGTAFALEGSDQSTVAAGGDNQEPQLRQSRITVTNDGSIIFMSHGV